MFACTITLLFFFVWWLFVSLWTSDFLVHKIMFHHFFLQVFFFCPNIFLDIEGGHLPFFFLTSGNCGRAFMLLAQVETWERYGAGAIRFGRQGSPMNILSFHWLMMLLPLTHPSGPYSSNSDIQSYGKLPCEKLKSIKPKKQKCTCNTGFNKTTTNVMTPFTKKKKNKCYDTGHSSSSRAWLAFCIPPIKHTCESPPVV